MCVSFKCILPGTGIKQFLLSLLPGLGGGVYFTGSLLGSISQSEHEAKRSNKKGGTEEKVGGYTALLSLVTLNVHKIQPKLL